MVKHKAITRGVWGGGEGGGGGDKGYGDRIMGPECSEAWKRATSDQ